MAGLYPPPDGAYSIAGLGQVYGQFYDGGPRGYGDDPWQRHNIIGGGQQSWLSADIAARLQSYSQQTTTAAGAAPAPVNFDFTLTLPDLPPLPDLVLPPAQTQPIYTNIPNVQVASAPNIGGALPPFQQPPVGRARIPGGGFPGGGGGGGGGGCIRPHSVVNMLGAPKSHSDAVFDTAAANDVLVYNGVGWAPLAGVAPSTRHMLRNTGGNTPDIAWSVASTIAAALTFNASKTTITSGIVTAEANSSLVANIATCAWLELTLVGATLTMTHHVPVNGEETLDTAVGYCGLLNYRVDADGHICATQVATAGCAGDIWVDNEGTPL